MLSHVKMSICLRLESAQVSERRYVLCYVCWLVLLLASEEARRENVLYHVNKFVLLLASQEAKRGREMVSAAFYVAPGK